MQYDEPAPVCEHRPAFSMRGGVDMRKVAEAVEEQEKIRHRRKILWIVLVLSIIFFSLYGWWQKTIPEETISPPVVTAESTRKSARELVVYVSGQVRHPGVLKVSAGARVIDAIDAAGGFADGADAFKVNLAQTVKDGMQIHVPGSVSPPLTTTRSGGGGNPQAQSSRRNLTATRPIGEKININTADESDLDKLPGIGPSLAARIVEWRREHGQFRSGIDIIKVPGVGETKYQQFKERITW